MSSIPIERMIALIAAADAIQVACSARDREIKLIVETQAKELRKALSEVLSIVDDQTRELLRPIVRMTESHQTALIEWSQSARPPMDATIAIAVEQEHFKLSAKRTLKNRETVRRHRARQRLRDAPLDGDLRAEYERFNAGESEDAEQVPAQAQPSPAKFAPYDIMAAYRAGGASAAPSAPSAIPRPNWLKPKESETE